MDASETLKTRDRSSVLIWLLWATWLSFFTPAIVELFQAHPPLPRLMLTLIGVAIFFTLYLWGTWRNARRRLLVAAEQQGADAVTWLVIGVMTAFCLVLPLIAQNTRGDWLDPFILTSAYVGGRLPPLRAAQVILLLILLDVTVGPLIGFAWDDLGRSAVYVAVVGFIVGILVRVITTSRELRAARGEIARLAVQAERLRLSRDLHDSVKQQIFAVSMQVGAALSQIEHSREAARKHLLEAEALVYQAQQDLTTLIQDLRPAVLQEKGLAAALRDYVTGWSRQNTIAVELHLPERCQLPPAVEEALWRVAQEALSNIARHSQASKVQMRLEQTPEQVLLSMLDNGRGFDQAKEQQTGVGLLSIEERMAAIGGSILLQSRPGDGTRMVARCPLDQKSQGVRGAPAESEARA
jgi:signal transduction histidine kinase